MLIFRRWNRRFRTTWLGKEFGWLLDELLDVVYFARDRIFRDLDWEKLQRFLSRPTTVLCGLLFGGILFASYHYGMPRYRRYVERQYAMQARAFFAKGDLMRANLRARRPSLTTSKILRPLGYMLKLRSVSDHLKPFTGVSALSLPPHSPAIDLLWPPRLCVWKKCLFPPLRGLSRRSTLPTAILLDTTWSLALWPSDRQTWKTPKTISKPLLT